MGIDQPKYDVALSFLSADEPTAAALHDRLSEGLEVFFFPRKQEGLAGTDGLESMRTAFLDCRIVVVLYREPWGKTPWTRVEEMAIKDSCLEHGWNRLFFIVLDKTSTLPIWLPLTHVRFNYADFGLEQAVGAIKARVQESGGVIAPVTASKRAELVAQEALYIEDKRALNSEAVTRKVSELFTEIEKLCADINKAGHLSIGVGRDAAQCVLTNDKISVIVCWQQPYSNSLVDCELAVREYNMRTLLPSEREHLVRVFPPTMLSKKHFSPDLSRAREYGWVEQGRPSQFLSSVELADKCVTQFLDLASRNNRGEVTGPKW